MRLTRRGLLTAAVSAPLVGALAAAREEPVARTAPSRHHSVRTGGSRTVSISGGYHVWVKAVAVRPGKPAVLTLHGGPGLPHFTWNASRITCRGRGSATGTTTSWDAAFPTNPKMQPVEHRALHG